MESKMHCKRQNNPAMKKEPRHHALGNSAPLEHQSNAGLIWELLPLANPYFMKRSAKALRRSGCQPKFQVNAPRSKLSKCMHLGFSLATIHVLLSSIPLLQASAPELKHAGVYMGGDIILGKRAYGMLFYFYIFTNGCQ